MTKRSSNEGHEEREENEERIDLGPLKIHIMGSEKFKASFDRALKKKIADGEL